MALLREGELRLERADDLLELLHLAPALQGAVPLALERAAGHDAGGVEHLAVERDEGAAQLRRQPHPTRRHHLLHLCRSRDLRRQRATRPQKLNPL